MNQKYQNEAMNYKQKRKELEVRGEDRHFYQRLGVQLDTEKEKKLDETLNRYRSEKKSAVLERNNQELYPTAEPFYKIKDTLTNNHIFQVIRKMPKGGLLHVHSAAALSAEGLLVLLEQWSAASKKEETKTLCPPISVVKPGQMPQGFLPGMLAYTSQIEEAKKQLQIELPAEDVGTFLAEDGNRKWLKDMLTISSDTTAAEKDIWGEFNRIFARTCHLFAYTPFYREYHIRFFLECLEDNIHYVEMRCGFEELSNEIKPLIQVKRKDYQPSRHLLYQEMLAATNPIEPDHLFLDELLEAVETAITFEINKPRLKLRVILNARRDLDPMNPEMLEKLSKKVDAAIVLKNMEKYRDFVIGFDFVSEEDRGQKTSVYAEKIIYQPMGKGYEGGAGQGWDDLPRIQHIDFFLHDGESNWNEDDNVLDAVLIAKHRIGHGFNMNKYMEVADTLTGDINQEKLPEPVLEICPISNQLLRYIPDLRNHPAYELMKRGMCCVICNDDPQILDNPGLSFDFWEAYMAMNLSLLHLKAMVLIPYYYRYFGYGTDQKFDYEAAHDEFLMEWNLFVDEACTMLGQ